MFDVRTFNEHNRVPVASLKKMGGWVLLCQGQRMKLDDDALQGTVPVLVM